jgi:hypothetical protein
MISNTPAAPVPPREPDPTVEAAFTKGWATRIHDAVGYARSAARTKGYALAVHGSLRRDVDLIAAPWTADAAPPRELAHHILDRLVAFGVALGWDGGGPEGTEKPHGRRAWGIVLSGDPFIFLDISVLSPRAPEVGEDWPALIAKRVDSALMLHSHRPGPPLANIAVVFYAHKDDSDQEARWCEVATLDEFRRALARPEGT